MYNKYLDEIKALEVVIHLTKSTNDVFHLMKVLYYAEKLHLERYQQSIYGDYFVKMEDGPVPSGAYDIVKCARGEESKYDRRIKELHPENAFYFIDNNTLIPVREPRLEYLSDSNIECLNDANTQYGQMEPYKLWRMVHNEIAYQGAVLNKPISNERILLSLPNGVEVMKYLTE
jgi:uncharacterized phage-associated protein